MSDKLTEVNVFGRVYKIEYVDLTEQGIWGEHDQDALTIRIQEGLPEETRRSTILHEIIHAVFFETGLNKMVTRKLEESICMAVEHGVFRTGLIRGDI